MGYRAEKIKVEKKIRILKLVLLGILLVCILGLCIFSVFVPPNTWKYRIKTPNVRARADGEMRIHFLDVGQGDSTLIELPDGKIMLIDGGDGSAEATKSILRYLYALDIGYLDYLVVSHADSDHCGGLTEILKNKDVGVVYLPPSNPITDNAYAKFYATMLEKGCKHAYSSRDIVEFGQTEATTEYPYTMSFLYPYSQTVLDVTTGELVPEDENENSSVIWLDYHGVSALFTGDMNAAMELKLLRDSELGLLDDRELALDSTEILKVAHHGSNDASSKEFLEHLGVKTAVISCGMGNAYGHPAHETLGRLSAVGAETYRTDLDEHVMITVSADSNSYTVEKIAK